MDLFAWSWSDSDSVQAWVSAFGTLVASVIALFAYLSSRKMRQRELNQEEKAQASMVSAWTKGVARDSNFWGIDNEYPEDRQTIIPHNASRLPIYEVVLLQVFTQGTGPQKGEEWSGNQLFKQYVAYLVLPVLAPQFKETLFLDVLPSTMQGKIGVEIGFSDAAGKHWIRRSNGSLETIPVNAPDHYGIQRPF